MITGYGCRQKRTLLRLKAYLWRAVRSLVAAGTFFVSLPAAAQSPTRAHAGPTLSLHEAIAAAWARAPQRQGLAAQQASAAARYAAGSALLPNAPYVFGTHVNDRVLGSNYGYITTQAEVGTPIWLPGQGSATQATAQADGVAVEAAVEAAHLALASQVLDLAANVAIADNARAVAVRRLATAQSLAADLSRRFRVGESSQSDALAASADALSAASILGGAEAQVGAAQVVLASVVGTPASPVLDTPGPPLPPGPDPFANHPRIIAATRSLEAAQAAARLTRIDNRDSPEVGFQGINEKQPGSRWDTRFGVTFRLPFATEARNAPRRAAAEQVVTDATVQLTLAQREVRAGVQQAQAIRAGAERSSIAATRAAAELGRRRGQIDRAWRIGEMALIEVVRSNSLYYDAEYARDKARIDLAVARLRLRLAEGVVL